MLPKEVGFTLAPDCSEVVTAGHRVVLPKDQAYPQPWKDSVTSVEGAQGMSVQVRNQPSRRQNGSQSAHDSFGMVSPVSRIFPLSVRNASGLGGPMLIVVFTNRIIVCLFS